MERAERNKGPLEQALCGGREEEGKSEKELQDMSRGSETRRGECFKQEGTAGSGRPQVSSFTR